MTTNANYLSALNRGTAGYYTAADAGAFNELSVSGSFAAFCAFSVRGSFQQFIPPLAIIPRQFLWGNVDSNVGAGWSLTIEPDSEGVATLFATLYDAANIPNATGIALGNVFERIVVLGLWFDGTNLIASVNGTIVSAVALGSPGYTPSALPARLLADPETAAISSQYVDVFSAGYSPIDLGGVAGTEAGIVGGYAGSHFLAFCEGLSDSYVDQNAGLDWLHRYTADSAAAGLRATTVKTAAGAFLSAAAAAPSSLSDVGNAGPVSAGATSPVALTRSGAPTILGRKNLAFFEAPNAAPGSPAPPQASIVDLYVSSVLGDDSNPGTEALPLATLAAVDARITSPTVTAKYNVHLRNETYNLPARNYWLRARTCQGGGYIRIFADEVWDPTVYTINVAAAADVGTSATTVVTAGLVVNAQRGRSIRMTSGAASGQYRRINSNTATDILVNAQFSPAPVAGDTFEIFTPATIILAPAATDNVGRYTIAEMITGAKTSQVTSAGSGALGPSVLEGLIFEGLVLTATPSNVLINVGVLHFLGVDLAKQIRLLGGQTWSGQSANPAGLSGLVLEGWGVRGVAGSISLSCADTEFVGFYHGDTAFMGVGAGAVAFLCGGFSMRSLNTIRGLVQISGQPTTPFLIEAQGGSVAIAIAEPMTVLELVGGCDVQGSGAGIQVDAGASLFLGSTVTGASASGLAMDISGASTCICNGAPVFGGAGNDWQVRGAAAFNKAALAAAASFVLGTDTSVATRRS